MPLRGAFTIWMLVRSFSAMSSAAHHHNHATSPPAPRAASSSAPCSAAGLLRWFLRAIPTAIVVAALSGLALWGHYSDWKMPKFSALVGTENETAAEWCKEHNVPEAE